MQVGDASIPQVSLQLLLTAGLGCAAAHPVMHAGACLHCYLLLLFTR